MSYYNLLKRNLKFFNHNLHNNSDTDSYEIPAISIDGGVKKSKKNKKKFNVIDFDFDDLVDADSEVFTNSKSINPFLRTATDEPIQTDSALKDEIINENPDIDDETDSNQTDLNNPEIYNENKEGRPINDEENEEDEVLSNENMLFDEAVEAYQNDNSDDEDNSSESSDEENDEHIEKYFSNYSFKGGKNISNIKDELANDKDIEEYTKNIKKYSSLTGGNIKPIKRGTNKLYPYNLY